MAPQKRKPSSDDFTIQIGEHRFDPADDAEPAGPAEGAAAESDDFPGPGGVAPSGPEDTRLVQFLGPLTAEEIDRLRRTYGLALTVYIPNHTYVERVPGTVRDRLIRDRAVRAVAPYRAEYKRSPLLDADDLRKPTEIAADQIQLDASLFDRGDPEAVQAVLESLGAQDILVLDDRPIGGIARVRFTASDDVDLDPVAGLADVRWIEPVPPMVDDNVAAASSIQSGAAANATIWSRGLRGQGQVIGVMDNGPLDIAHCFFADTAPNTPGPTHRKVLALRNASGTAPGGHATFVAGCAGGDDRGNPGTHARRGGAFGAKLVSLNRQDLAATTLLAELTASATAGAFIHSNSWHDNAHGPGNPAPYNQNAVAVDTFTFNNENHIVFGSSGNNGEEQGAPGTAKNAVCVSAAQSGANLMNIGDGNPGPTADRRNKPDLVTVGCNIQSATVGTPCGTGPRSACATSYATPHAAAAAALVRQYFTEGWYPSGTREPSDAMVPTGALLKAALITSTVDMTGVAGYPNPNEGWGLVRLDQGLYFDGGARRLLVFDVRHAAGPSTGDIRTHKINVIDNSQPLKITLVFTDPPGPAGSTSTSINDLDLKVTAPDGTVFRGNDFTNGSSTANSASPGDPLEPVEVVLIPSPNAGDWTIEIEAFMVALGNPGQGYAVAISGNVKTVGCFVASAVYENPHHPDVEVLRAWRDRHLDRRAVRLLDTAYRRLGPPAAGLVERWPRVRRRLRRRLFPALVRRLDPDRARSGSEVARWA